jgi:TonB-dependent receptor
MNLVLNNVFATPLRRSRRWLTAAVLFSSLLIPPQLAAQETSPETGTVTGRVFNASNGAYLNNARVRVEGTTLEAFTDSNGGYSLRSVPAGEARLRVTYTGQPDLRSTVTVQSGEATTANFTYNSSDATADPDTVVLDKFVVEASRFRNAQELAINEERFSVNIKSVVSMDSLGYIKDGNIGEFVRFLPGVDVEEGGFGAGSNSDNAATVAVRGFGPDSTTILIDGVPLASGSTGALTRAVQLDAVSVNNASRLEIIKVATPDMRQDSPGGTINLITRGAFELAKPVYTLSAVLNANTLAESLVKKTPGPYGPNYKTRPSLRASVSIPLSKTLGVTGSASWDSKYSINRTARMRDWFYTGRTSTGSGVSAPVANANGGIRIDNPVLDRLELNEQQWIEDRQSGSLRVDWRPIPALEIRASGTLALADGIGMNRRTQWRYSNAVGIKDWGDGYITGFQRTGTFNPNVRGDMNVDARDKRGFTTQGSITANYRKDLWKIYASASASESYTVAPDRENEHFSSVDAVLSSAAGRMDITGIDQGVPGRIDMYDTNGAALDYTNLANWNTILIDGFRARSSEASNRDLVKQYKLDVSREIDFLPFPLTLKAGGMQEKKSNNRWGAGSSYEMRYIGPSIANSEIVSPYTSRGDLGYGAPMQWMDGHKIYQLFLEHPEYFDDTYVSATQNVNTPAINYLSRVATSKAMSETTSDWYGMATAKFFSNRLTVIGGTRQSRKERTGYNVFNDPVYQFVKNADGTIYRDSVYTNGVRFDGNLNTVYAAGDPRRAANVVMTDTALRTRMQTAGVEYLPTQLELAPNGTPISNMNQNLFMARRARSTRYVDAARTEPLTPQLIMDYNITETLKAQVSWTKEHRLPDLEGSPTALLVQGASFQISQNLTPTGDPGSDGTIQLANLNGDPEINTSYNFKLAYFPKNGSGKYSISYYYKVVDNVWETNQLFNDSPDYGALLSSLGLSADDYVNYRIDTVTPLGIRQIRKGFEIELAQNFGIFAPWAKGIDAFVSYTRRPSPIQTGGELRLGWILAGPVRAKWTGGLSYSTRRLQVKGYFTYTESGITHDSAPTVTLPDGTNRAIQLYNLNEMPPEVRLQADYVLNKNFSLFATVERVLSRNRYTRLSDDQTGYMPEWATYRNYSDRGIAFALGATATF